MNHRVGRWMLIAVAVVILLMSPLPVLAGSQPGTGNMQPGVLAAEADGVITGRVTDEAGAGVPDVRVSAYGRGCDGHATTDSDGYYSIAGLQTGHYEVEAWPPQGVNLVRLLLACEVVEGQTTALDFVLAEGGIITGRVTDASGSSVSDIYLEDSGPTWGYAYADSDGYYAIVGLASGNYEVTANHPSGVNLATVTLACEVVQGQATTLDFVLPTGGTIIGRVTDEAGAGVPEAGVSAYSPACGEGALTDSGGYYAIVALASGSYEVTARCLSGVSLVSATITCQVVQGQTTTLDFVLSAGGIIAGRVTDEAGVGVPDSWVDGDSPGCRESACTDSDGYYTIVGLAEGDYEVTANPPFGTNLVPVTITCEVVKGETTPLDFVLLSGGSITGRVTDESGAGVPDSSVDAQSPGCDGYAITDSDGYYTIVGLASGDCRVTANRPPGVNLVPVTLTCEVVKGEATTLDFVLPTGGMIAGRVTDEAGAGLPGAYVDASALGSWGSADAVADGSYSIVGLPSGIHTVVAYPPDGVSLSPVSATCEVVQGKTTTLNFVLPEGGIITGRVTDEAGGGVRGAYVYASGPGDWYSGAYTLPDGRYSIIGLPGGSCTVTASPQYLSYLAPVSTAGEVVQGETTTLDFVLPEGGVIAGRVTDEAGAGVHSACIQATGLDGWYFDAYTHPDGRYSIIGLPGGSFNVTVLPPQGIDLSPASATAEVVLGETTTVDFVLQPADITPPAVPDLLMPADGYSTSDSTPTLDWSDVSDPSGVTYMLQVDDDPAFSSPVLSKTSLASSGYTPAPAEALPDGAYYWRVRAIDGAANAGLWTDSRSLTVATAYPAWDISGDGKVNYKDLAILGSAYGAGHGDPGYRADADINQDGVVNYKDLAILGAHYGESY